MKDIVKELMESWKSSMIDVKCTNCHHERQATNTGMTCDWCKEGTMEKVD